MRYSMIITVSIEVPSRAMARLAAKQLYAGVWDAVPELPQPNPVTVVVLDHKGPFYKIDGK